VRGVYVAIRIADGEQDLCAVVPEVPEPLLRADAVTVSVTVDHDTPSSKAIRAAGHTSGSMCTVSDRPAGHVITDPADPRPA
jgi:hypothetical protein